MIDLWLKFDFRKRSWLAVVYRAGRESPCIYECLCLWKKSRSSARVFFSSLFFIRSPRRERVKSGFIARTLKLERELEDDAPLFGLEFQRKRVSSFWNRDKGVFSFTAKCHHHTLTICHRFCCRCFRCVCLCPKFAYALFWLFCVWNTCFTPVPL